MPRKQTTPIRSKNRGYLDGSIGHGATAPTAAPVTTLPAPTVHAPKPHLPVIPGTGMVDSFRASGVENPRGAADHLTLEYLSPSGRLEVPPPLWEPTPAVVTRSLLYGNRDLYEIDTNSTQFLHASNTIAEAVEDMESRFPRSYDCAHSILTERLTYVDAYDSRPVHGGGKYSLVGHEFTWRMDEQSLTFTPGAPTSIGEVDELLSRDDRTLRSIRDVAVTSSLRGEVSLRSGAWSFDHDSIASEALGASMDADSKYQLLAVVYSGGASTNTGFDSVWFPGEGVSRPATGVATWVRSQGFDGDWFAFGSWASERSAE